MKKTSSILVFIFSFGFLLCAHPAIASGASSNKCVLGNRFLSREIRYDGRVGTTKFKNKLTGRVFNLTSDEFRLVLNNGSRVMTSKDFALISKDISQGTCIFNLISSTAGVKLKLRYTLDAKDFWTRKTIEIEAGENLVNEIDVENFSAGPEKMERFDERHDSKPPWDWPGGRPVFIARQLFAGLEYPAGWNEFENGVVRLHHYPGRKGTVVSKTAVIGVAADTVNHRIEDAFSDYISAIRVHPPRRFILWNAYFNKYDANGGASYTFSDASVKQKVLAAKKAFPGAGARIDAVLIDGGWTDPQSLMEENRKSKTRLKLVRELSEQYLNCPIGVHVITHGIRSSIDKEWLKKNFDMIDGNAYCFADPRAADLEIKNLLELQRKYKLAAFKFDWGNFACEQSNHRGHLPGERYAREAITDNNIRMLRELHAAAPNVYLYNTGWYSPWWLKYYDSVFSGEDDYNNGLVGPPSFNFNDIQETWRDTVIRRNIVLPRTQFPLNSLMNHSPISNRWIHDTYKDEKNPLNSFANSILMNYIRGNGLVEMYMNLFNFSDSERALWGQIAKWATANNDILLSSSAYIGGDPSLEQTYGYAHFNKSNEGIVGVRNPAVTASSFSFVLSEAVGFHKTGKYHTVKIAYPYEASLGDRFKYGDTIRLEYIPRGSLFILTVNPADAHQAASGGKPLKPESISSWARKVSSAQNAGDVEAEYEFTIPGGVSAKLVVLSKQPSYKDEGGVHFKAVLNGKPVEAKRIVNFSGTDETPASWEPSSGWVLNIIDLPEGKSVISFSTDAPADATTARLIAESPYDASLPVFSSGLPATWNNTKYYDEGLF
ncbi:MAG TPA: hypothetical protein PLQ76_01005 [bacterium]|nr:hypothetical protein [bacterium]